MKTAIKLAGTAVVRSGARAAVRGGGSSLLQGPADTAETGVKSAISSSFKMGYSAAVSGTALGLVSGVAFAANVIVESPLFIRSAYKIHRKEKFGVISRNEAKRQITIQSFTSVNTIIGRTAGAVIGQAAIPVPIVGAAIGGFAGVVVGKSLGNVEGRGVALFITDKDTDLPIIIHSNYVPMDDGRSYDTRASM